jgi:hypothetical protein
VRLTSFSVAEFQSYRQRQHVTIEPHLTLIAGRNDVGKSALLRAMRVYVERQQGARQGFEVGFTWTLAADELLALTLLPTETSNEYEEWARSRESHALRAVFTNPGDTTEVVPGHVFLRDLELLDEGKKAGGGGQNSIPQWYEGEWGGAAFIDQLSRAPVALASRIRFITPRRIEQGPRALEPIPSLEPDARNLTNVLLDLIMNHPTTIFRKLVAFMNDAFPEIDTLSVMTFEAPATTMGEMGVLYRERDEAIPLRLCGTGVEQMLALAIGVLTAQQPVVFLIDEPQAYLHPHAERTLLTLLEEHAEHQYVIATHSHYVLGTRPLSSARLLTLEGGTTVTEFPSRDALLSELGITAADLWLADSVLWVEGPSEVEILDVLTPTVAGAAQKQIQVRRMPDAASRFSSASTQQAEATYRFCADVVEAVSPLPVKMLFLFDGDEKSDEHREQIEAASAEKARFLPMREVENLFLDIDVIQDALSERARLIGVEEPTREAVEASFQSSIDSTDDRKLYPRALKPEDDALTHVRGSEVLRRMYWELTISEYEKVADGRRLAELTMERKPDRLEALRVVIGELVCGT